MPRRPRPSQRPAPGSSPSKNGCRHLVLLDSRPIREKMRRDYNKTRADLAKAQADLDQFHKHDRPQFERWLHSHFGKTLTELRSLRAKLAEAELLIFEVHEEAFFTDCSYQRAYQRVSRRHERGSDEEKPTGESGWSEASSREGDSGSAGSFEDFFSRTHGFTPEPPPPPTPPPPGSRLRQLYRALVRLLHPDHNDNLTPHQSEMWHQAQAAYQGRDEGQLEVLLTLCELERKSHDTRYASASLLQRIIQQLKRSLREIRRQLRNCKADPAWKFATTENHELLHHQTQRTLEEELFQVRRLFEDTQNLIRGWQRPARRRRYESHW